MGKSGKKMCLLKRIFFIESDLIHFVSFLQVRVYPKSVLQMFAQSFTLSDTLEKYLVLLLFAIINSDLGRLSGPNVVS